jgi:gamma-glutamyl:cysteine ligase YbdK (ATP-grasp superfamily)
MGKLAPSVEKPGVVALLARTWHGDPRPKVDAWEQFKAKCTPLEAETAVRNMPSDIHAICFALAGKIDRARQLLAAQSPAAREHAVELLFARAHPIADAGDDRSAGREKFLTMYQPQDVWHDRAVQALRAIETHQPLEQREAHFAE